MDFPVVCDRCDAEGTTATLADWSFTDGDGVYHEAYLCERCECRVESDAYDRIP